MLVAKKQFQDATEDFMFYKVLCVDDQPLSLASTKSLLETHGFSVETADGADQAVEKVKAAPHEFAVVILDYDMPGKNGAEAARALILASPDLIILMHSGVETFEASQSSWEAGAIRFISKNVDSEVFVSKVKTWYRSFEKEHLPPAFTGSFVENERQIRAIKMVGRSNLMAEAAKNALKYAPLKKTVLIIGETGAGKERVAKALHYDPKSPLVDVNCATFKGAQMMESELFGHVKGSFTGAVANKTGLFETAHGGTIHLDEIHTLDLTGQQKLLRALQDKKVRPLGSVREYQLDFRLVVSTQPVIKDMVARKEFLPDLYQRFHVLNIEVPPLRDRPEDIEPLVHYFCKVHGDELNKKITFQLRAIRRMERYTWPGNVRELDHMVERLVVDAEREIITDSDLDGQFDEDNTTLPVNSPLRVGRNELERTNILSHLQRASSIRDAARRAGVPESTLRRLMQKHHITYSAAK